MEATDLLVDAFGRIRGDVHHAVGLLEPDELALRLDPDANSIAWLVWHLTRVQDDHVSELAGAAQVWTSQGWADRFALPFGLGDTGYGHSSEDVAAVRAEGPLLVGYQDAVYKHVLAYLDTVAPGDLDHVIDERYHPPVTTAVRLVSVVDDAIQHAGQAAFISGVIERRG